jgi:Actin
MKQTGHEAECGRLTKSWRLSRLRCACLVPLAHRTGPIDNLLHLILLPSFFLLPSLAHIRQTRTMTDTLHNAPIVLDNGSGTIRAGFAGDDLPKCYFPSFVGRPKHLRVLAGSLEGDVFIGQRAQELRGLLKIKYPLEHGIVTDWDDMERIWQFVYNEELKTLSEEVSFVVNLPIILRPLY